MPVGIWMSAHINSRFLCAVSWEQGFDRGWNDLAGMFEHMCFGGGRELCLAGLFAGEWMRAWRLLFSSDEALNLWLNQAY